MSYILDALQRAEAERERDRARVPGLYSPGAMSAGTSWPPSRRQPPHLWYWLLGVATLVVVSAGLAWWWSPAPPLDTRTAQVSTVSPQAQAIAETSGPVAAASRAETPAPAILAPAASARKPAAPKRHPASAPTEPTQTSKTAPDKAPPTVPLASLSPVRNWTELPAETRAQLPQLSVNGSTYSANAAHRMLIANGQVLQEGQTIAPGLVLESIGQRSAVLNHRGMRYSIAY